MSKLGVIVLNYNDSDNTIRVCKEYEKMTRVDKIIVVDNQSPDLSFKKLKNLKSNKIDVIETKENKGYSAGNNFGIRYLNETYGEYDFIAISNPDISIKEDAINACVNYLIKNKNVAICAPKMLMKNGEEHPLSGWKLRSIRGDIWDSSLLLTRIFKKPHIEMYDRDYMKKDIISVDCIAGSFFIIKNKIFKEIGYFDEHTFLYFEEDILGKKISKLGYKNIILNKYNFQHFESVSVDKSMNFMKKYMNLQKSKIYYHKTYNENCNFVKLLIIYFFTYFRYIEQFSINILPTINRYLLKIYKLFVLILMLILHPIKKLLRVGKTKKILYFSVVNWKWIKQRPHFVPLFLCDNGYKVDYVYEKPYKKYIKQQQSLVQNLETHKNLKIKEYKFIPYYLKKAFLNKYLFVTRTLLMNYDKIIFTNPHQISNVFVKALRICGTKIYYECMDNYIYWENENTINLYKEKEEWLVKHAEKIIVSSEGLKNIFIKKYSCEENKIVLIRNGYNKEIFENIEESPLKLKHPNATYIGTIDEWFDFEPIVNYAQKYKDVNFYIIGPIGETVKEKIKKIKEKNIIFCEPIEHKYVPNTIEKSDVMLLPFIVNSLIEDVDPVKAYEYLYMKKPTVSSYWKELDQFSTFIMFYKTSKEFETALNKAFKLKIKENKEYEELMKNSNWNERLKKYLEILK